MKIFADERTKRERTAKRLEKFRNEQPPERVFAEYRKGIDYKSNAGIYENAKKYENFFLGKQWEGVNAPSMDKPVFNILKRVINYFIANLVSDNIAMNLKLINREEDEVTKIYLDAVKKQIELTMERGKFSQKTRKALRDAAVMGDGCMHIYYDPSMKTGHAGEEGAQAIEVISSTDVMFGNPMSAEVQEQPYIIIGMRRTRQSVIEELEAAGKAGLIDSVIPDGAENPTTQEEDDLFNDKVTVLIKYWKIHGRVYFTKVIKNAVIIEPTDTGMGMYPICYMNWETRRNSMHGVGLIEGLVPNQIAINKLAAMAFHFIKQQAFPRIVYDKTKLHAWENGMKPIGVNGSPGDVVGRAGAPQDMSQYVPLFFDKFVETTRDLMGASDAALGNVNPNNTSAIIAVQKATAVPLELVKQEYYQFIEDFVRISIEMMGAYYGKRTILVEDEEGTASEQPYDFAKLADMVFSLGIDIGATSYWQETTDVQTLDNLRTAGILDDLTYVESLPAHNVPNRAKIIAKLKERVGAEQALAQEQQAASELGAIANEELGAMNTQI